MSFDSAADELRQQLERAYDELLTWANYLDHLPLLALLSDEEIGALSRLLSQAHTLVKSDVAAALFMTKEQLRPLLTIVATQLEDALAMVQQRRHLQIQRSSLAAVKDEVQRLLEQWPVPTVKTAPVTSTPPGIGASMSAPKPSVNAAGAPERVHLAIITAMSEELQPILELSGSRSDWRPLAISRYSHYYTEWSIGGQTCAVLACAQGSYGGDETVAAVGRLAALRPRLLAMTGICAGRQESTQLGDLIVADRAYRPEEGKRTNDGFRPDIQTYQPPAWLLGRLREFAADTTWHRAIRAPRPRSLRYQGEWLLCGIASRQRPFPESDADWQELRDAGIDTFAAHGWLRAKGWLDSRDQISDSGQIFLRELRMRNHGELAPQPSPDAPGVHYGAFASTVPVIAADEPFLTYRQHIRKVEAIELEVRSLFSAAANQGIPAFAVKGVSDYATPEKDDAFHDYAAEAAARWMQAFVLHNIDLLSD